MYYVDSDYFNQLSRENFKFVLLCKSVMFHKGGDRLVYSSGKVVHFNKPWRFYYMGRNSIIMLKKYRDFRAVLYVIYLLAENFAAHTNILQSVFQFSRGLIDGIIVFDTTVYPY